MMLFLDDDNVIRVRGREDAAAYLTEFAKNPVVLPKHHRLSRLMIEWEHRRMRHKQQETVICNVLQRYRISHLRQLVKAVRPFTYTGIDYFGPLNVTTGRRRKKRWVAIFTCSTVRAVHLELAANLSTDACLLCIWNIVNLRGVPIRIRSDNRTNFVVAANVLKSSNDFFDHAELQRALCVDNIEWIFGSGWLNRWKRFFRFRNAKYHPESKP